MDKLGENVVQFLVKNAADAVRTHGCHTSCFGDFYRKLWIDQQNGGML